MKRRIVSLVCAGVVGLTIAMPASAGTRPGAGAVAVDALLVRPVGLVATLAGSVLFVVSLPLATSSSSVHSTADALVSAPAWVTFKRPLGDFSYAEDAPDLSMLCGETLDMPSK